MSKRSFPEVLALTAWARTALPVPFGQCAPNHARARIPLRALTAALILLSASQSLNAQIQQPRISAEYLFQPGNVAVSVSAGGAAFTDFRHSIRMVPGPAGEDRATRRISARTTGTMSAALSGWITRRFGLQAAVAYAPTRFNVTTEDPARPSAFQGVGDSTVFARLDIWDVSASILLRPPVAPRRVSPYAIIGAGAMRYAVRQGGDPLPEEAAAPFHSGARTQPMAILGAGAVIPLQRSHLLLMFDVTDRLTRTPLREDPVSMTLDEVREPDGISLASSLRLTVGITIPLKLHPANGTRDDA